MEAIYKWKCFIDGSWIHFGKWRLYSFPFSIFFSKTIWWGTFKLHQVSIVLYLYMSGIGGIMPIVVFYCLFTPTQLNIVVCLLIMWNISRARTKDCASDWHKKLTRQKGVLKIHYFISIHLKMCVFFRFNTCPAVCDLKRGLWNHPISIQWTLCWFIVYQYDLHRF